MIFQITLPHAHTAEQMRMAISRHVGPDVGTRIVRRSIDARNHREIKVHYSITTDLQDASRVILDYIAVQRHRVARVNPAGHRLVVVGSGPAGLFCALWLQMHGFQPVILEQGPPMRQRVRDMAAFMKRGELRPYSNICFGAGGAGTYSDGKLITRIRSPFIPFVMDTFVRHGAPEEIRWLYNPHLGSNLIRRCIARLIENLGQHGAQLEYHTRFTGFDADGNGLVRRLLTSAGVIEEPNAVFLACGHSSRETYAMLRARETDMRLKEFAVGVRVEHPAQAINCLQYGSGYRERYPGIETAQYRFAKTWKGDGAAVYSFCMCPGGYVLNASTESDGVVTNGMSNHLKSGRFSNAAVVTAISTRDLSMMGYTGIDAALNLQRELEGRFCRSVNRPGRCHIVPGQRLHDFLSESKSGSLNAASCLNPVAPAALHALFPDLITRRLTTGFHALDASMRGFVRSGEAQIFGVESRTSSPYRIDRDAATGISTSHPNLYPMGEGAGYAGGITSAAVDGIKAAQNYLSQFIEPADFETRGMQGAAADIE
jgi:uncharacterized protein